MPITQRYRKRRAPYRGRPQKRARIYRNESPPRGGRDNGADGCIKIVIGRSRVRIWNNCDSEIVINDTLQIDVINAYKQTLSGGGKALVIFGEPVEEVRPRARARAQDNSANEESDYGDIPEDVEEWI